MAERPFVVQFRTEPGISDEVRNALSAAGIQLVGSHGGGTVPPGGDLPQPYTHTALVDAEDGDEAGRKVTQAVKGKTAAFELLTVEPSG